MTILELALGAYAVLEAGATVSTVTAGVRKALGPTTVEDLFIQCFRRSVNRNAKSLEIYTEDRSAKSVDFDESGVRNALTELRSRKFSLGSPDEIVREIAPSFVVTLVLPGHQQPDIDLIPATERVLLNALQDFFSRLPFNESVFREVMVHEASAAADERGSQDHFRDRTEASLDKIIELLQSRQEVVKRRALLAACGNPARE